MKLISCHIENFGKLHDWSHDFTSGSNVFCEDNGWGKSTLASFIKVMFYGFSGDGKHSDTENERHHYMLERVKLFNTKWVKKGHRKGANTNNVSSMVS